MNEEIENNKLTCTVCDSRVGVITKEGHSYYESDFIQFQYVRGRPFCRPCFDILAEEINNPIEKLIDDFIAEERWLLSLKD